MLFCSFEFLFFFLPITFLLYFKISKKSGIAAHATLLICSLIFYAWQDVRFVALLAFSVTFNFVAGIAIENFSFKRVLLFIAITINIGLLCYFKYTNFLILSANRVFHTNYNFLHIILPLGISFFTFQELSYVIDVYKKECPAEKNPLHFALYVAFFPQLIAGPIISHNQMISQIEQKERLNLNWQNISFALALFSVGLFKKIVIADSLSPWVQNVFSRPHNLTATEAWCGVLCYTFQLYFDFSAYSEMAIALGRLFNFDFPTNFDSPYSSSSIIEFWRRWHITLGSWIRNYIYIPLGGNRRGTFRKYLNLFISMSLCGIWHGAGLKFLAWGMAHGALLVINNLWRALCKKIDFVIPKTLGTLITFFSVMCTWVIFRATRLKDAIIILKTMFNVKKFVLPAGGKTETLLNFLSYFGIQFKKMPDFPYLLLLALTVAVFVLPSPQKVIEKHFTASKKQWLVIIALFLFTLYKMIGNQDLTEFLYFQF